MPKFHSYNDYLLLYKNNEILLSDSDKNLLDMYSKDGEKMKIWSDGLIIFRISKYTDSELIFIINKIKTINSDSNNVFLSILIDVVFKRRINKINKIKEKIHGIIK